MDQATYDHKFYEIVEPYHYEFDQVAAACDPRITKLALRYLNNDRHIDYDMIWQVADEYRISRNDVLDYACALSMQHILEDENRTFKHDDLEDHNV